mmetsp:Transcript_9661/g.30641  ORF Transcript_9661/g.30641 Transcript_9661/m.30641 type:complete len:243 (-) Transcript_9661:1664-2392(-)
MASGTSASAGVPSRRKMASTARSAARRHRPLYRVFVRARKSEMAGFHSVSVSAAAANSAAAGATTLEHRLIISSTAVVASTGGFSFRTSCSTVSWLVSACSSERNRACDTNSCSPSTSTSAVNAACSASRAARLERIDIMKDSNLGDKRSSSLSSSSLEAAEPSSSTSSSSDEKSMCSSSSSLPSSAAAPSAAWSSPSAPSATGLGTPSAPGDRRMHASSTKCTAYGTKMVPRAVPRRAANL